MMLDSSVTALVRGTGSIGMRHLQVLQGNLAMNPVAWPTRTERVPELREAGFRAIRSGEVSQFGRLASVVATNTGRHTKDVMELLPLGNVLVEKPLAATADEAVELQTFAANSPNNIWVAYCLRFHPALRAFRDRLCHVGALDTVRIECSSFLPEWRPSEDYRRSYSARRAEGGVLRDLSHELDFAVWLFGGPRSVYCLYGDRDRLSIEAEESADLLWHTPSGASVSMHLDYISRIPKRVMSVSGVQGRLVVDLLNCTVVTHCVGKEQPTVEHFPANRNEMYVSQARAFLGVEPRGDLATLGEGVFIAKLIESARESAKLGRAIEIEQSSGVE